jgi:uncharacterized Zn finger protein
MNLPFTETDLRRVAAHGSFERGLDYLDSVSGIDVRRGRATATVYGSDAYLVSLTWADGEPDGACTCPHGENGFFCKHCVALGLTLLRMDLPALVSAAETKRGAIEDWLRSLSHEELVAELVNVIDDDAGLRRRYELRVASSNADIEAVRRSIHDLLDFSGGGGEDYSGRIAAAAIPIRGLIDAGKAEDAIDLAREALDLLVDNIEMVDESGDWAIDDLLEAHLLACEASPPEVKDLAHYLADWLLRDEYGVVPEIEEYAELLGEEGMALIREQIAETFARDPGNWIARSLMEAQAKEEGDVDALIAVYAANPVSNGQSHMLIARELESAGRDAEALTWAERGLRECAFPYDTLADYVAGRYASAGRDGDVLELRRARFAAEGSLANYRALRQAAQVCGDWPAERESALARLRVAGSLVLIDALTDDGDIDAAWETAPGIATNAQMVRLADASIETRPSDALAVYLKAIAPLYQLTGDDVYRRMATLLVSARSCHEALGTPDEFERYVDVIRTDLKRKRNLIRILDENGL